MRRLFISSLLLCAGVAFLVQPIVDRPSAFHASGADTATYTVQPGDTLSGIALAQGTTVDALVQANNLANPDAVFVGQTLAIPGTSSSGTATADGSTSLGTYTVQWGDTLSDIATRYGTDLQTLINLNNLSSDGSIQAGQQLAVPSGGSSVSSVSTASTVSVGDDVGSVLTQEANAFGIDPTLVKAIAWQESGWSMITAADGGIGVMQLMPDSVDWISTSLLGYQINPYNLKDNIDGGLAILRYELNVFPNTWTAVAAYHEGLSAVQNNGVSAEGSHYADNVLALQQRF